MIHTEILLTLSPRAPGIPVVFPRDKELPLTSLHLGNLKMRNIYRKNNNNVPSWSRDQSLLAHSEQRSGEIFSFMCHWVQGGKGYTFNFQFSFEGPDSCSFPTLSSEGEIMSVWRHGGWEQKTSRAVVQTSNSNPASSLALVNSSAAKGPKKPTVSTSHFCALNMGKTTSFQLKILLQVTVH